MSKKAFVIFFFIVLMIMILKNLLIERRSNDLSLSDISNSIIGDVNGDGKVNTYDYVLLRKYILKQTTLDDAKRQRADTNGDGKINTSDYIMIRRAILYNTAIHSQSTTVSVTGVSLNKTSLSLKVGGSETLTATVAPSNATDKNVTWTSSDTKVATVSNGKITAVAIGSSTITVTTNDGKKTASCNVTVNKEKTSKIHFINTGASNAFLLESNGSFALIDSSNAYKDGTNYAVSDETYSVEHVKKYLKKIGVSKLDAVIASHSHSDHIGGMPVIAKEFVNSNTKYYYRAYEKNTDDVLYSDWDNIGYYQRAVNAMKNAGASLVEVTNKNPTFKIGAFDIQIINTASARENEKINVSNQKLVNGENKNSLVVFVKYGNSKILFTGDMEVEDEMDVASIVGHIDILQMGHHGSVTSSQLAFLNAINPSYAVIPTNATPFIDLTNLFRINGISYIQRNGGKVYVTGDSTDAIIANCESNACLISSNDGLMSLKTSVVKVDENSFWEQVEYDKTKKSVWLYYKNGIPLNDSWIQVKDWYYVGSGGVMLTGWNQVTWSGGLNWFYFNESGAMQTGWQKLSWNGVYHWYYFEESGAMISNTKKNINGSEYTFDSSGACVSGKDC